MTPALHPAAVLFAGEAPLPPLPAVDHYAGSEKLIRKALEIQQQLGPVVDITCDCEDGAKAGDEAAHALMCARLANNLSLEDLAERTKVSTRFLRALEADDFGVFASRIYIMGFAKAYAKVVGLDIEGVASSLRRQLSPQ